MSARSLKDHVPSMEEIEAFETANREDARLIRDMKRTRMRLDGVTPAPAPEPKADEPPKPKGK